MTKGTVTVQSFGIAHAGMLLGYSGDLRVRVSENLLLIAHNISVKRFLGQTRMSKKLGINKFKYI